jgi:hypothetical protein
MAPREEELSWLGTDPAYREVDIRGLRESLYYANADAARDEKALASVTAERDELKATIERVRRLAQVWVDSRPMKPTANDIGHVIADVGQLVINALTTPTDAKETP